MQLKKKSSSSGWITSRLSILSAERRHSGVYACSINNSTTVTVDVQILNGMYTFALNSSMIGMRAVTYSCIVFGHFIN